jgi:hypothetical protein
MMPSPLDATPAETVLLSQSLEAFQTLALGNDEIILSVLDSTTDLTGTLTGHGCVWLFAEDVVATEPLDMVSGVIAVHALDSAGPSPAQLSIAGAAGTSTPSVNTGSAPGVAGGPGGKAQTLSLFVESAGPYEPDFAIDARGGDGGAGQRGAGGCPGADGGAGGRGGAVTVLASTPVLAWLSQLRVIAALSTVTARQKGLNDLLATLPAADARLTPTRTALQTAAAATTSADQLAAIELAEWALCGVSGGLEAAIHAAVDASGGRYGVYGDGTPNGTDGASGVAGEVTTVVLGASPEVASQSFPPFFVAHPSQCARLLEKARLQYLVLDPVGHPDGVTDLMTMLLRLQARTQIFVDAPANSPLIAYYQKNEATVGAVGSVAQLQSLNDQATRLLLQLRHGKDLFGNNAQSVPLGSFGFYKDLLDQLIADFTAIETSYEQYFAALATGDARMQTIKDARGQQQAVRQAALTQLGRLEGLAQKTVAIIDGYKVTLPPLKAAVDKTMQGLEEEINNTFDFDFDSVMQSLSTLAFAPESEFMMVATAGQFLYNGSTKIVNDQGVPIKREYVVSQVLAVKADVDGLTEGFAQLDNGMLAADDPAAGKLITDEQQFETLMAQFDGKFTAALATVKSTFDAYIAAVVARNNQILNYNATVLLMLHDQQLAAQATADLETLTDQQLATMQPQTPALATFVSGIYAARSQVMETLDLTARAYRFWALSDTNLLSAAYGGKPPPEIGSAELVGAQTAILDAYQQAIEGFGTNASAFPPTPKGTGLIVHVPAGTVQLLPAINQLMVTIPVVKPGTTAEQSPFAGMADVRVTLVRAWIDGVKTSSGQVQVRITHTGREQIASAAGAIYTFTHEPVTKLFKYVIGGGGGGVIEEANFGCAQTTADDQTAIYAALGPFTTWQIKVEEADNPGLDLSALTGVRLEFHGTNLAFP